MDVPSVYRQPVPLLDVWRELGGGEIRRGRGRAFWRRSLDWNISVDLDGNVFYDYAYGCGGGSVSLVMEVLNCSAQDAGRWLREHFGGGQATQHGDRAPRLDPEMHAEAETIRIALAWHIETQLVLCKSMLHGPCHRRAALRVRRLTRQQQRVYGWTLAQAVSRLQRLGRRRPAYVAWLYREVEDSCIALARAIAGASA